MHASSLAFFNKAPQTSNPVSKAWQWNQKPSIYKDISFSNFITVCDFLSFALMFWQFYFCVYCFTPMYFFDRSGFQLPWSGICKMSVPCLHYFYFPVYFWISIVGFPVFALLWFVCLLHCCLLNTFKPYHWDTLVEKHNC